MHKDITWFSLLIELPAASCILHIEKPHVKQKMPKSKRFLASCWVGLFFLRKQLVGESNPCFRRERAAS